MTNILNWPDYRVLQVFELEHDYHIPDGAMGRMPFYGVEISALVQEIEAGRL